MEQRFLSGKKIAVILEAQYIPSEIEFYQNKFSDLGAEIHLMSRLWGQNKIEFISEVEFPNIVPQTLEVNIDFTQIDVNEYAAVIMAANYTSVRLRWIADGDISGDLNGDSGRQSPAVKFFYNAMLNPKIVKGFPCHGLWILTPIPEMLAGRNVTCNRVMLGDVRNAGGIFINSETGVVVDSDIVTSNSSSEENVLQEFVNSIQNQIVAIGNGEMSSAKLSSINTIVEKIIKSLTIRMQEATLNFNPLNRPVVTAAKGILNGSLNIPFEIKRLTNIDFDNSTSGLNKSILIICSKFGTWASEFTIVAGVLLKAGFEVKVATEDGSPPHLLSPSLDPTFEDGAWRCSVVSIEERDLALKFLKPGTKEHQLLDRENVLNLQELPKPPQVGDYIKTPSLLTQYDESLKKSLQVASYYDAIVITGGSGAIPGLIADRGLHSLILAFNELDKPIMGECNGGLAIAQTINPVTGKSILAGRAVTTHSWLDEYQSGWGWVSEFTKDPNMFWENGEFDFKGYAAAEVWNSPGHTGNPLIDSEAMFSNAAGIGGIFFSPPGTSYSVVVDRNIITCRTTPDGYPGVIALLAILGGKPPLTGRFFIDQDQRGRTNP